MAIFYSDTASFSEVEVSASLLVSGSGSNLLTISGSLGGLLSVSDLTAGSNIFQITSASIDIFKVNQNKQVHISGSLIITGSLIGNFTASIKVSAAGSSNNITQLVFSNSNNVSFGLNGSTVTATATAPGFTFSYFNPQDAYLQVAGTYGINIPFFQPMQAPNVQFDRIAVPLYLSHASNSSMAAALSFYWGAYTRSGSTLNLLTAYSKSTGFQFTFSSTNSVSYHGIRLVTIGLTNTLTEGQYYIAQMSAGATTNAGSISNIVASQQNSSFSGIFGVASDATNQYTRGLGRYSTTTGALPASIAFSQIQGQSSIYLRQPVFYLVSQTF